VKYSYVLSTSFLLLIGLPLIAMAAGFGRSGNAENRHLARLPKFERDIGALLNYPQRLDSYFADNFGLRNDLLWLHSSWNIAVRGQSPHSSTVAIGTEGWLFYRRSLDQHNLPSLSEKEITDWVIVMKERASWINSQDAHFLFVIVPDKATVYPEHLPENLTVSEQSFRKQIVEGLKENSDVDVLDLTDSLIRDKQEGLLYDLTDTHWNDRGAFLGASLIIKRLQKTFPEITTTPAGSLLLLSPEQTSRHTDFENHTNLIRFPH